MPPFPVLLEPFRPEDTGELVALWRESFESGVGLVDWAKARSGGSRS